MALLLLAITFLTQRCELKKVVRLSWFGLVWLCPAPTKLYHFQIVAGTLLVTGEVWRTEMGQQKLPDTQALWPQARVAWWMESHCEHSPNQRTSHGTSPRKVSWNIIEKEDVLLDQNVS